MMRVKVAIVFVFVLIKTISAQPLNNVSFQKTNSSYDELNPVISPDGKTLFMTIANHPYNIGGKKDPGDIWFSVLQEGNQWSVPVHAGSLLNDRSYNGIAGFSSDGKEMYLLSHYDVSGNPVRTQGISVSRYNGNEWSRPENISIPYFHNKSSLLSGYLSGDKSYFVFSAETYGTYGVEDLFVSIKKSDGKWSEPKNLGPKINTQFQELTPFLSYDGKTLYFSSNGRKGLGSFDIYSATRLDDSWSNWSDPVNLGPGINTEGRDLFYRLYPSLGISLFTSTKNSDGYGDIRMFPSEDPLPADTTITASKVVTNPVGIIEHNGVAENKSIMVHGMVVNAKSGESINAYITFETPKSQQSVDANTVAASATNGYSFNLPPNNLYTIKIEARGYISALEKLDIKTLEMKDLEMNFKLQPVEVGTTVNLRNVLFEQSKTALLSESYEELDMVVAFLKENPQVRIDLAGHTDNRGIPSQNVKLSQARVDKVKSYLVSKGIDRKRISGKGYGGSKPIASNDNEETRQLNRRVEFTIKKY